MRNAQSQASGAATNAANLSKQYGTTANTLAGQLTPIYSGMATNPQGMTRDELNNATTSSMQSTGGSVAGAVGQGDLAAARTGNAGGYQAALRDAARRGIATNADNALSVQNANTGLKEAQRMAGISGLQGLQSENQADTLAANGQVAPAVNAEVNAGNSGWFQNLLGFMNAAAGAGKSAASLGAHV